jgi:hypothetical protein
MLYSSPSIYVSTQGNRRVLELNIMDFRLYESYVNLVAEFTMKDLQT